jgi:hypothetical protein
MTRRSKLIAWDGRYLASDSGDIMKQGFIAAIARRDRDNRVRIGMCLACLVNSLRRQ